MRRWGTGLSLAGLVLLFALVMIKRDMVRAYWWAWQLGRTSNPAMHAYYLASLSAVGEAATPAVHKLATSNRAEVRAMAVIVLAQLPHQQGLAGLGRLLGDADSDVAESAAVNLAFMVTGTPDTNHAEKVLLEAAASPQARTAAHACAALSRVYSDAAWYTLCNIAQKHADSWVRAQAVESLAARLMTERGVPANWPIPTSLPWATVSMKQDEESEQHRLANRINAISILITALADQGTFDADLSLERQIAAVSRAAARPPYSTTQVGSRVRRRTVAQIAAVNLGRIVGRTIDLSLAIDPAAQALLRQEVLDAIRPSSAR